MSDTLDRWSPSPDLTAKIAHVAKGAARGRYGEANLEWHIEDLCRQAAKEALDTIVVIAKDDLANPKEPWQ